MRVSSASIFFVRLQHDAAGATKVEASYLSVGERSPDIRAVWHLIATVLYSVRCFLQGHYESIEVILVSSSQYSSFPGHSDFDD